MKTKSRLFTLVLALFMSVLFFMSTTLTVGATGTSRADSYNTLMKTVMSGKYTCIADNSMTMDCTSYTYKTSGGGFLLYTEITGTYGTNLSPDAQFFSSMQFEKLTSGAKQQFLQDVINIGNAMVYDTEAGYTQAGGVTSETMDDMLRVLQNKSGMGSQMLATLMSNTKPDYASASKLYAPFSGVVGTLIALIAILIMSLLGLSMALDLAYIVIPPVQMALGGDGSGEQKKGGLAGLVSTEAKKAVQAAAGSKDGNGEYKAAVGIYLKYRWIGLTILGICLLYLVSGEIYSFVAWFIDLFSGFLGF